MESLHAGRPGCNDPERGRLLDGYLEGSLPRADEEAFEAHYFSCKACLDEMEFRQTLPTALRGVQSRAGSGAAFRLDPRAWGVSAAALIILLSGYAAFLALYRLPALQDSAGKRAEELQAQVREMESAVDRLGRELDRAQKWAGPVAVHYIGPALRGRGGIEKVQVAPGQPFIHLAVEITPPRSAGPGAVYRLTLADQADRATWSAEVTQSEMLGSLQAGEELVLAIPAARLVAGIHTLRISFSSGGQEHVLVRAPFEVLRTYLESPAATNAPQ